MRTRHVARRHWVAVLAVAILSGAVLIAFAQGPRRLDGAGVIYGHLWCMGIRFDSGEAYPVSAWPPGYLARRLPGNNTDGVVMDGSAAVVLREGQRVTVDATVTDGEGDTPCSSTKIVTVLSFEPLPSGGS